MNMEDNGRFEDDISPDIRHLHNRAEECQKPFISTTVIPYLRGLRKDGSGGELQHDVVFRANLHHDAARDQNAKEGPGGFGVRDGRPFVTGPETANFRRLETEFSCSPF